MTYQNNKISELIEEQLPNFLQEEGPKFVKFVEKYYEWMETSKLEVSVSTGGTISLSSGAKIKATKQINGSDDVKHVYAEVINSYLLDNGNYLFYIKEYNEDPNSPQTRGFSSGEAITIIEGDVGSSGTISVVSYIQNATLSSKNLWNLQDIDRTLDEYVDFFMKEYLEGFPLSFPNQFQSTDIDVAEFKKFLVKHSREFYQSKGTEDSFKYFFRTIFNEDVTISYPKDNVLKPSDNTFSRSKTITVNPNDITTVPEIASQKIVGQISGVSAYIETISSTRRGGYFVYEIVLNEYGISGDFLEGENIYLESDPSTIIGTIYYGASSVSINDVEESFTAGDIFYIDRSGEVIDYTDIQNIDRGALIELDVCSVNSGKITDIEVVNGGIGYSVGDKLIFDNTKCLSPTGPSRPIEAVVSEVNESGVITKINVHCAGKGYIKYPTLTQIGDHNITSESFNLIGNDVGTLKQVKIRKTGIGYKRSKVEHYLEDWEGTQSSLVLDKTQIGIELPYLILNITNPSGDFTVGEIVNHQTLDGTGKVVSWDSGTDTLVLREYSGVFISADDDIIEGVGSGETGTVGTASYNKTKFKIGNGTDVWADLNYSVASWYDSILNQPYSISLDLNSSGTDDIELNFGSIFDDGGRFLNNNSFISDVKYIQDSFYYQVYSYLLESSVEVRKYRDLLKRLIHPAGMKMFGRISTETVKQVKMSFSQIKTNVSMVIWDYIGKHSNKLIRDFDFLYSLLILDGDDSSPLNIETEVDGSDSGVLIPQIYYHGSYACDYLYNENTHQNYRFKIKYKNLRPGTPKKNDFYEWNKLNGTVSIPHDTNCDGTLQFFTLTGVGTQFTQLSEGDVISAGDQLFKVVSINSDTELILNTRSDSAISGSEFLKRELIGD